MTQDCRVDVRFFAPPAEFADCFTSIYRLDLATDVRFATNEARVRNRETLIPLLRHMTTARTTAAWVRALEGCAVPCGPINGLGDVFADPQVRARELRITMDYPGDGPIPLVASPMRLSDTPVDYRLPPPSLGAHTEEVLLDLLGMSPQAIRALRERGVV